VKQGFAHKRKILIGNLSGIYERKRLEQVFSECSLPPTARAEDVSINTWKKLAMSLR
jgi:16S rRNA A1518/A1519 N6-dimethyltransferase RsmA/KsgA/DIM1 with predicted DNA glycosylase/AP lyase activity